MNYQKLIKILRDEADIFDDPADYACRYIFDRMANLIEQCASDDEVEYKPDTEGN